jgi:SAM-dependent methyltransferase
MEIMERRHRIGTVNFLAKYIGWKALLLGRDPTVTDRLKWLKHHLKPGNFRTLDVGCASGYFTFYAAKIGNQSVGIDIDERGNRKAKRLAQILGLYKTYFLLLDIRILDRFVEQLGKFDQIICFETIEHIRNGRKLLKDLSCLLKPGGKLLLTAPFKFHKPINSDTLSEVEDGGHMRWGYTHDELQGMFRECNIEVATEEYIGGFILQQLLLITRFLMTHYRVNKKLAWLIVSPFKLFLVLDPFITKLLNYPYLSVAVTGIKRSN